MTGIFDGFVSTLNIDVRFADTDQMGVVHHGVYILWLEMGRIAWLKQAGLSYAEVSRQGYNFAVIDIACHYRRPIYFGDDVCIRSRVTALRSRQINFAYEVRKGEDDRLCASGESRHICVDRENQISIIPEWVMSRLHRGVVPMDSEQIEVGS